MKIKSLEEKLAPLETKIKMVCQTTKQISRDIFDHSGKLDGDIYDFQILQDVKDNDERILDIISDMLEVKDLVSTNNDRKLKDIESKCNFVIEQTVTALGKKKAITRNPMLTRALYQSSIIIEKVLKRVRGIIHVEGS